MPSVVGVADPDPLLRDLRRVEIARGYMHIFSHRGPWSPVSVMPPCHFDEQNESAVVDYLTK